MIKELEGVVADLTATEAHLESIKDKVSEAIEHTDEEQSIRAREIYSSLIDSIVSLRDSIEYINSAIET